MRGKVVWLTAVLQVSLLSCGGGGTMSGVADLPAGGATISINSFRVSSSTLSLGSTFVAEWNVSWREPSGVAGYNAELIAFTQPTLPGNPGDYRIAQVNCGSPIYGTGCFQDGRLTCTIRPDYTVTCRTQAGGELLSFSLPVRGSGYLILRACTFDIPRTVCATRALAVNFPN